MLAKSRKSAFIMGSIFILTAFVTSVVGTTVFSNTDSLVSQESVRNTPLLGWLALVFLLLLAVGMVATFIYNQDESHFGPQGAVRWAIAGVIYALLIMGISLLFSRLEGQAFAKVLEDILQLLAMGVAYLIVFEVFSPRRDNAPDKKSS